MRAQTIREVTGYPALRVKARQLKPGDHYTTHPLGKLRRIEAETTIASWPHRLREETDVLWFDYEPEQRSLYRELAAWMVHGSTGLPLESKRYNKHNVSLHRTKGVGGSLAIAVRLYSTDIITVNVDDLAELRTGGWPTMTTSQYLEEFLGEGWCIDKQGSDCPWLLLTPSETRCGACGAPEDRSWSEPCEWSGGHYVRPGHEIAFREGMIVDLRSGLLVNDRDRHGEFLPIVTSWARGEGPPRGWQSSVYGRSW